MEISNFLASVLGLFLVFVPLSLLAKPKKIKELFIAIESESATYIAGIITFVLGCVVVLLNNIWTTDWKVIVTILGWLTIVKGLALMFCSEKMVKYYAKVKEKDWISYALLIAIFIGLFAIYFGFTGK